MELNFRRLLERCPSVEYVGVEVNARGIQTTDVLGRFFGSRNLILVHGRGA